MNATNEAFGLFQNLETGTQMVTLNGFDSELVAVVSNGRINLFQSYGGENTQSVFLPDDCYKGLIKILQENINNGN